MKPFYYATILLLIIGLGPAGSAWAQPSHQLETITVEAPAPISPEQSRTTVEIPEAQAPVISTIPDVLDKTPGLDIQSRGILTPKNSQVKIRGFDERRSLILLDGRPLNGTGVMGGQFVDWSSVSTDNWKSVNVGKGAFSAKYGNTLGGTIEMIPEPIPDTPTFSARTGYKRYNTFSLGASGAGSASNLGLRLSAAYDETDGNLRNSGADRTHFGTRLSWRFGDTSEVYAGVRYTDGDFEMPVANLQGAEGFDPEYPESVGTYLIGPGIRFPGGDRHGDGSYYTKSRYELDLGLKARLMGLETDFQVYLNNEDREDFIYAYKSGDLVLQREATPDRSWGWVTRFQKPLGDHIIGFGGDANYQGYGGTDNTYVRDGYFGRPPSDGADESDGTRWHGAYVDDQWKISDMVEIYFGLRYEDYIGDRQVDQVTGYQNGRPAGFETITATFNESALLPKLGAVFTPVSDLSLHGRFARATRFPDNPAFYWYFAGYRPEVDPGSDVVRDSLTYEDALEYEAGATYTGLPGISLGLNVYHYEVDDYIRWIFGYAPSRVVYNIDEVELDGLEIDLEGKIYGDFFGFANLTWQESRKSGDVLDSSNDLTDSLSELPEFKWNLGLKWQRDDGARASVALRWVDDREVPYLGTPGGAPFAGADAPDGTPVGRDVTLQTLDDFMTVDVLVKYPVWKGAGEGFLTAGVENLFDEDYEEEFGFPQPEQTFHIGTEIRF